MAALGRPRGRNVRYFFSLSFRQDTLRVSTKNIYFPSTAIMCDFMDD